MAREYFCAYHSYLENIKRLNDEERGRLFTACLQYSASGKEPELHGNEVFVWDSIRVQINRDREKYEALCGKNRENIHKRYDRIPSNTTEYDRIRPSTKSTKKKESIYNSISRNSSISRNNPITPDSSIQSVQERCSDAGKPRRTRKPFVPPTLEEIKAYIAEKGYGVDAQKFFDYFMVSDWVDAKGNPVLNWKQKIITWNSKNTDPPKEARHGTADKVYDRSSAGIEIL